jgi:hypothetical protein
VGGREGQTSSGAEYQVIWAFRATRFDAGLRRQSLTSPVGGWVWCPICIAGQCDIRCPSHRALRMGLAGTAQNKQDGLGGTTSNETAIWGADSTH